MFRFLGHFQPVICDGVILERGTGRQNGTIYTYVCVHTVCVYEFNSYIFINIFVYANIHIYAIIGNLLIAYIS